MDNVIIKDSMKKVITGYSFNVINTNVLDLIASELSLTGDIEGTVSKGACTKLYKVWYENGVRCRFIVGTFAKKRA